MGDEYTFDDYECVIESYDLGEVVDDQWGDEEYSQEDQYAALADRHYAQQLVSVSGSLLWGKYSYKHTVSVDNSVAVVYN